MVAKAREMLSRPENDRVALDQLSPNVALSSHGGSTVVSPLSIGSGPSEASMTLESFRRKRKGAPLEAVANAERPRAGLKTALSVAKDDSLMQQATATFAQLRYAAGTSETKDALFKTWSEVLRARGEVALPVAENKLVVVAFVLRASGYRAGLSYLLEAKQRHSRCGYPWSEALDIVLKDCKRVFNRAIGPAKKAEEIKLEWLQATFDAVEDWNHPEARAEGPWASRAA